MPSVLYRHCSWCFEKTFHNLYEHCKLSRNVYQCEKCKNFTLECRYCQNMTRGRPKDWETRKNEGFFKKRKTGWNSELCAEHDGTIASFEKLSIQLNDLQDYKPLFKRDKYNLLKAGKYAGGIIGGTIVFAPLAFIAAPSVAAALGSAGMLGAASTGTAISTLSGAALTSASLAAIGGGTMAAGMVFVTASGAALGAVQGGVISNSYFSNVKDFDIKKVRAGKGPALIFINGFLSQKKQDSQDWQNAVRERFPNNPQYHVNWESKSLYSLGTFAVTAKRKKFLKYVEKLARRASRKAGSKLNPLMWATIIADLLSNDWHVAMVKASMTGILLADLLSRVPNTDFILMGNSLGCRVIFYTLAALGTKDKQCVKEVYLLGGAVGRKDEESWEKVTKAVENKIYNCYSDKDWVLKYLYKPANALLSDPIGLGDITYECNKISNLDVSPLVKGHLNYKENFSKILRQIHPNS